VSGKDSLYVCEENTSGNTLVGDSPRQHRDKDEENTVHSEEGIDAAPGGDGNSRSSSRNRNRDSPKKGTRRDSRR